MSNSPEQPVSDAKQFAQSEFRRQLTHLDDLINHGGSLSGNEANCAFRFVPPVDGFSKNDAWDGRYATASYAMGFDHHADGRAMALTDWDHDGDVDVWLASRTAPRVRYFENSLSNNNHSLRLRLIGTVANRDAIGARVVLRFSNGGDSSGNEAVTRVVRAGDGFLSQSSKTLVIGVGPSTEIAELTVHWPGSKVQSFQRVTTGRSYALRQGGELEVLKANDEESPAETTLAKENGSVHGNAVHVYLASRLHLPSIPVQLVAPPVSDRIGARPLDEVVTIQSQVSHGPCLLNLWASWCLPCQEELATLIEQAPELRRFGLRVVAVSTDKLGDRDSPSERGVQQAISMMTSFSRSMEANGTLDLGWRFGWATDTGVRRLQWVDDTLFTQQRPLGVPTSFLLDAQGRLAAIYRGAIDVAILRRHLEWLNESEAQRYRRAVPFAGRWFEASRRTQPLGWARKMAKQGAIADAANYLLQYQDRLKSQRGFATLAAQLGGRLGATDRAMDLFRASLATSPNQLSVLNNLAWILASRPEASEAQRREAIELSAKAARLSRNQSPVILDTLATAYHAAGQFEQAVKTWRHARRLAAQQQNTELVRRIDEKLIRVRSRKP